MPPPIRVPDVDTFKEEAELDPARIDSGVYILWRQQEIVYIGQSVDIFRRLIQHRAEGKKAFDRATWSAICQGDDRLRVEGILILRHLPRHNRAVALRIAAGRVYEADYGRLFPQRKASKNPKRAGLHK